MNIQWKEITRLLRLVTKTKAEWREDFSSSSSVELNAFVEGMRIYWENVDDRDSGPLLPLVKERSIELIEMAEAELLQRSE